MSNIPNSAMPHAWAAEGEQQEESDWPDWRDLGSPVSLGAMAVAGGIGALLVYWLLRK